MQTVFLQKFEAGAEKALALQEVIDFLNEHGTVTQQGASVSVSLPADYVAASIQIIPDGHGGVLCLSLQQPRMDDDFRNFAFEAMVKFGVCLFDEALTHLYVASPATDDIPAALRRECAAGAVSIYRPRQLFPTP